MRNRYFLLLDLLVVWVAALMAFVLRFDLRFTAYRDEFLFFVTLASLIKPLVFLASGIYGRYWRYASIPDLATLFIAMTAASIAILVTLVVALWAAVIPAFSRSVVFNDWLLTCLLVGAFVAWYRPRLRWQVWAGGLIFTVIYATVLRLTGLRYPTFYDDYWNLKDLSGIRIGRAPLEEFLFAFGMGVFWAPLFESWRNERQARVTLRRSAENASTVSAINSVRRELPKV